MKKLILFLVMFSTLSVQGQQNQISFGVLSGAQNGSYELLDHNPSPGLWSKYSGLITPNKDVVAFYTQLSSIRYAASDFLGRSETSWQTDIGLGISLVPAESFSELGFSLNMGLVAGLAVNSRKHFLSDENPDQFRNTALYYQIEFGLDVIIPFGDGGGPVIGFQIFLGPDAFGTNGLKIVGNRSNSMVGGSIKIGWAISFKSNGCFNWHMLVSHLQSPSANSAWGLFLSKISVCRILLANYLALYVHLLSR